MSHQIGQVPSPNRLADRAAIEDIIHLHCRGVDRADTASLKHCYWPEATAAYGKEAVPAQPFCETLAQAIKGFSGTHHLVSNVMINFSPDEQKADVETYLIAFHYSAMPDAGDQEMTYLGRYLDRFEKRDNQWKIMHRQPIMSWSQNAAASHDEKHPALSALTKAARYPDDPVYGYDQDSG